MTTKDTTSPDPDDDVDAATEAWGQLAREAVRSWLLLRFGAASLPKDLDDYVGADRAALRQVGQMLARRVAIVSTPPSCPCRNCGRPKEEHKYVGSDELPLYVFCRAGPPGTPGWREPAPGNSEFDPVSSR